MTPARITDALIHQLVSSTHAEGIIDLDVAAAIQDRGRVLLVSNPDNDFEDHWDLPAAPVLPGENLLDALCRSLTVLGLQVAQFTGYLGHHDHDHTGNLIRVFCFAVTVTDPRAVCRTATTSHHWADLDDPPSLPPSTWSQLIDLTTLPPTPRPSSHTQPLSRPLRAGAAGFYPVEVGVELLIHHATWLARTDFVEHFVHLNGDTARGTEMADIDWVAALAALDSGTLPCSSSEDHMLRLAASMAAGTPANLRDALTSLDHHNARLVSEAVLHANGRQPTTRPP